MGATAGPNEEIKWLTNYLSSLYRKEINQKPPKFDNNGSMQSHIQAMEKYMALVRIDDDLGKICILLESINQSAKDELMFEINYEANASSYDWHVNKLNELFPLKENTTTNLAELYELKQRNLSFNEFATQIKSEILRRSAFIKKDNFQSLALDIFLTGFNDKNLSLAVRAQKPTTLKEALVHVKTLKVKKNEENIPSLAFVSKNQDNNNEINDLKKQVAYLTQIVLSLRSSITSLSFKNNSSFTDRHHTPRSPYKKKECSFCNMSGHTIDECFKKGKRTFTNEKVCFICHKKGHIARVCNEKRVNQINWNTSSCIEGKESDSIPDNMTFLSNTSSEKEYRPVIYTISFTQQHKAHKKTDETEKRANILWPKDISSRHFKRL